MQHTIPDDRIVVSVDGGVGLINLVLAACIAMLIVILGVLIWRGNQVHFVALGRGIQAARPGEVPQQALEETALFVVRALGNVTPDGMESAVAQAKRLMTAPFQVLFVQRMQAQQTLMREHDITMLTDQIAIAHVEKIQAGDDPIYRLQIDAVRTLWVGAIELPATSITITLDLAAVISNTPDFAGLWINDMAWPAPHVKDQDISDAIAQQPRYGTVRPGR